MKVDYSQYGQSQTFTDTLSMKQESWGVGLNTSMDLFRTAERAAYKNSLLGVKAAERALDQQREETIRQTRRQIREVKRAERRIQLQKEASIRPRANSPSRWPNSATPWRTTSI